MAGVMGFAQRRGTDMGMTNRLAPQEAHLQRELKRGRMLFATALAHPAMRRITVYDLLCSLPAERLYGAPSEAATRRRARRVLAVSGLNRSALVGQLSLGQRRALLSALQRVERGDRRTSLAAAG